MSRSLCGSKEVSSGCGHMEQAYGRKPWASFSETQASCFPAWCSLETSASAPSFPVPPYNFSALPCLLSSPRWQSSRKELQSRARSRLSYSAPWRTKPQRWRWSGWAPRSVLSEIGRG